MMRLTKIVMAFMVIPATAGAQFDLYTLSLLNKLGGVVYLPVEDIYIEGLRIDPSRQSSDPQVNKAIRQAVLGLYDTTILDDSCPAYNGTKVSTRDLPSWVVPRTEPGEDNRAFGPIDEERAEKARLATVSALREIFPENEVPLLLTAEDLAETDRSMMSRAVWRNSIRSVSRQLEDAGLLIGEYGYRTTPDGNSISLTLSANVPFHNSPCHVKFLESLAENLSRVGIPASFRNCLDVLDPVIRSRCLYSPSDISFIHDDLYDLTIINFPNLGEDYFGRNLEPVLERLSEEGYSVYKDPSDFAGLIAGIGQQLLETGTVLPLGGFVAFDKAEQN